MDPLTRDAAAVRHPLIQYGPRDDRPTGPADPAEPKGPGPTDPAGPHDPKPTDPTDPTGPQEPPAGARLRAAARPITLRSDRTGR
jgi:hypothetical protein